MTNVRQGVWCVSSSPAAKVKDKNGNISPPNTLTATDTATKQPQQDQPSCCHGEEAESLQNRSGSGSTRSMASTALKAVGEWGHVRLADSVDRYVGDVQVGKDWVSYVRSNNVTGKDFVTDLQQGSNAVCEYFELNCGCEVTPYIVEKWIKGLRDDLGVDNALATATVDDATAQKNMATIPRLDSNYGVFETSNSVEPSLPVEDHDKRDGLDVSFSELPVLKHKQRSTASLRSLASAVATPAWPSMSSCS